MRNSKQLVPVKIKLLKFIMDSLNKLSWTYLMKFNSISDGKSSKIVRLLFELSSKMVINNNGDWFSNIGITWLRLNEQ